MHTTQEKARRYPTAALLAWMAVSAAGAVELMPTTQQNALVQKYCAVCHTDAAMNGGLSLEHFDATNAAPSLTAMLVSKLSGGVALATIKEVDTNPAAAPLVDRKMKSGAIGAAGIPRPDKATINAWILAFAVQSAGAAEWAIERTKATEWTASILREVPSATNPSEVESSRFIASCNQATQKGSLQLAWSPVPQSGALSLSVDGVSYRAEGSEKMGNAAVVLTVSRTGLPFPAESLVIRELFPGETVKFSFSDLPKDARRGLEVCFSR